MKIPIQFACRFWFPRYDRPVRYEHGQRLPVHEDWRWHRYSQTLWWEITDNTVLLLPAPFFTFSAATLQRIMWYVQDGGTKISFDMNGHRVFGPVPWHASELWTEVKFDPPGNDEYPNRGPWWLRWRVPNADDMTSHMMSTLDGILAESENMAHVHAMASSMRREILMWTLGGHTG